MDCLLPKPPSLTMRCAICLAPLAKGGVVTPHATCTFHVACLHAWCEAKGAKCPSCDGRIAFVHDPCEVSREVRECLERERVECQIIQRKKEAAFARARTERFERFELSRRIQQEQDEREAEWNNYMRLIEGLDHRAKRAACPFWRPPLFDYWN